MALLKSTTFKSLTIQNAYHRVWGVTVSKDTISFGLGFHATAESEMIDSATYRCSYDLNGANPIAQAYAHLKTFPEFSSAVDC
jgi:hypothetical protein